MKSMTFLRDHCRSHKDMGSESYAAKSSFSGDGSADFKVKGQKVTKKENDSQIFASVSPMNTSDEESLHNSDIGKFKWNTESSGNKSKVMLQNRKLRRQLDTLSVKVLDLEKENGVLRKKLKGFENGRSIEEGKIPEKSDSLKKSMAEKDRQIRELWYVVQMLDDENMVLKNQSEKCEEREKQLNMEINDLKFSNANNIPRADITVSYKATNWKNILDKELSNSGIRSCKVQRKRDTVSKKMTSGCSGRWRESKEITSRDEKKLNNFNVSHTTEPTNLKVIEKAMSSVNFASEDNMLKKIVKKVKGAHNEQVNYAIDWSNEELLNNPCGSKRSTWGSGLWPPEWTTVTNLHHEKNWCENSKVYVPK